MKPTFVLALLLILTGCSPKNNPFHPTTRSTQVARGDILLSTTYKTEDGIRYKIETWRTPHNVYYRILYVCDWPFPQPPFNPVYPPPGHCYTDGTGCTPSGTT